MRIHYIILFLFAIVAFSSCQEKKADFFEREAKAYTAKHCPQQLDEFTRVDSVVYVKNEEAGDLRFYYSVTFAEDTLRTLMMDHLGELGDSHLKNVRNSVLFTKQKEAGVTFTYIYYDAVRGDNFVEYHFTPEDYR